ncbi:MULTISPECIES: hypothetical protein [unclassified Delftia]|uniref:hypothetical protein n=1 Tax=unclassified Delftia TaxID=2613839 RepID=UPI0019002D88|nr:MULTISPECIES: hypothetical protein [unclassified Delftia]MBK0112819.1 hypothetical protein [Delftia sp. S65]MBK0131168.1 hypothetical protein [Delftia sp. S66]
MRNLFRTLCALALLVFGAAAHADFGRPATYIFNGQSYPSAAAACKAVDPSYPPAMGVEPSGSAAETYWTHMCLRPDSDSGAPASVGSHCPDIAGRTRIARTPGPIAGRGVTLDADTCNYSGSDPDGTGNNEACKGLEDFCSDRKKQGWNAIFRAPGMGAEFVCHAAENANSGGWSEPAFPGCSKGCMVSTGTTVSVQDDAGKWYTTGTGSYAGSTCDPNVINKLNEGKEDEKEVTPPDSKDPGKCNGQAGTVNGKDVCLPWSGAEGDNKSETKKNPDGSTTKTDTKTTCTGNSCTTTTTTTGKDSSGNTTGTTTTSTTTTKDDYCSKNSGSSVCGALDPSKKPGTGTGGGSGGSGSGSCEGADCEDNDGPTLPGKPAFGKFGAPEQPKLYTTKYPDGIAGVWSAKTAEIKSAPIANLVGDLMPKVADGGTPPTWIIDLDMGGIGNFGQRDISPPSWLWGVLKAITILSALLLARRLVFGG